MLQQWRCQALCLEERQGLGTGMGRWLFEALGVSGGDTGFAHWSPRLTSAQRDLGNLRCFFVVVTESNLN